MRDRSRPEPGTEPGSDTSALPCPFDFRCERYIADGCAARTEQSDDLCGAEQDACDENDVYQSSREIIQLAAEDQHTAGDRNGRERDEPRDRPGDRLLDLLQWTLPWQAAAASGKSRFGKEKAKRARVEIVSAQIRSGDMAFRLS
jgi:hypothetical protein